MKLAWNFLSALAACGALALFCGSASASEAAAKQQASRPASGPVDLPTPPSYICKKAAGPIKIDGSLDELSWQEAERIVLQLREGCGKVKQKTTARIVWDDKCLYVSWVCEDTYMWATMRRRDSRLWKQEVVELFIDPLSTGKPYYEYEVNPLNTVIDLRHFVNADKKQSATAVAWDSRDLQTAIKTVGDVQTQDTANPRAKGGSWTVEIAIPFSDLDGTSNNPPRAGDRWKVNVYRIDRPTGKKLRDDEYSAWSPIIISGSFHTLSRFGTLIFSDEPVGQKKATTEPANN